MGMRGTVSCRPTLAYRIYTLTALISAIELITKMLAGKALTVNMLEVNCFQTPMVPQPFVSQHKALMRELVNYFLMDVAQVYRVYMIWELALNPLTADVDKRRRPGRPRRHH